MVNNSKKNKKCYKKKYLFLMFLCLIKGDFESKYILDFPLEALFGTTEQLSNCYKNFNKAKKISFS